MQQKIQWVDNIILITVSLLVIAILCIAAPKANMIPRGIVLPLQQMPIEKALSLTDVQVYQTLPSALAAPVALAHINVEGYYRDVSPKVEQRALDLIRTMAAKIGANAIVPTMAGYSPEMHTFSLSARAYHINIGVSN